MEFQFEGGCSVVRMGILGAGTMGVGIAQTLAESRHEVLLLDVDKERSSRAKSQVLRNCRMNALLGRPAVDLTDIDSRLRVVGEIRDLHDVDFVIESITEDLDMKSQVYERLGRVCGFDVILIANTSAIPITLIASMTSAPERVVGVHFMNPVPLKHTVELIPGHHTADSTIARTTDLLTGLGMRTIRVKDSPGFVSNRVLMLTINEAAFLVHEGVATAAQVDDVFRSCFGHPMGPLETADLIGVDTILQSVQVLHSSFDDGKYRPCPLLKQMVAAGLLGKKSGEGFYPYLPTAN